MTPPQRPPRGRGTASNPHNRFAATRSEAEQDGWYDEATPLTFTTSVRQETAKTVISRNQSPDVGFDRSVNPYRGCEHGCICHAIRHFCSRLPETQSRRGFEWYGKPSNCLGSKYAREYLTP